MHEKGVGRYVVLFRMILGRALTFLLRTKTTARIYAEK